MHPDSENLIGQFTAFFHHGLLLVEDAGSTAAHTGWEAATEYVHFDTDSLYLAVAPAVDGPVTVHAYRNEAPVDLMADVTRCFDGEFESKSGRIKVHDPDDSIVLMAQWRGGTLRLRVLVDELGWSSRVVVVIG